VATPSVESPDQQNPTRENAVEILIFSGVAVASYYLIDTPFEHYAWFRRKRDLHFIHHRDARYNFAVVEFWIDRLMGTQKTRI
jgi:sterol desaturase/sphingolipid hydroxylase (fatty acid hydroxylase superfamily)